MVFLGFAITVNTSFRRLKMQQVQGGLADFISYLFAALGTGSTLLQLYNVASLGAFWPFFTGILLQIVAAMLQFARMILLPPE